MNMVIEQGPICLHIGMYTLGLVSTGPLVNVTVGESGPVTGQDLASGGSSAVSETAFRCWLDFPAGWRPFQCWLGFPLVWEVNG